MPKAAAIFYGKAADVRQKPHQRELATIRQGCEHIQDEGPWELVYHEEYANDTEARKREIKLEKGKKRKYLVWLIKMDQV